MYYLLLYRQQTSGRNVSLAQCLRAIQNIRLRKYILLPHSFRSRKIIAILTFQVFPNSTPTCILPFTTDSRRLLNSMISSTELLCSEAFLAHALFYAISQNLSAEDLTGKVRFSFSQGPPLALPSIPMPGGIRDKQIIWREK